MRSFTRVLITLTLSVSVAATCTAQKKRQARHPKQESPARARKMTIITTGPVISPVEERMVGSASLIRLDDSTVIVAAELGKVYRRGRVSVGIDCSFSFEGKKVSRPDKVRWFLYSEREVFKEGDRMLVTADGKQFQFTSEPLGGATDGLDGFFDFESFEQIVAAQSIKVRVGEIAFTLDNNHREALRDMLKAIETPPK